MIPLSIVFNSYNISNQCQNAPTSRILASQSNRMESNTITVLFLPSEASAYHYHNLINSCIAITNSAICDLLTHSTHTCEVTRISNRHCFNLLSEIGSLFHDSGTVCQLLFYFLCSFI